MGKNRKNCTEDLFEDIEEEDETPKEKFEDGLSDISISDVDVNEKGHIEIDKMNLEIDILVQNVKNVFEERFNELVPKDPREIKFFIQNLSDLINQIATNYSSNIQAITDANKKIRNEAKDYYERYKELKRDFKIRRRDLKMKNADFDEKMKENESDNKEVGRNLDDLKLELNFFKQLIGIDKDNDVILMANILDSIKGSVDIYENLSQEHTDIVNEAIKNYVAKEDREEEKSSDKEEEFALRDGEDRISEDEMTRLVENEVNMVFGMDLIRVMDIKSVPNNFYYFDDIKVRLGSFNSVLRVLDYQGVDEQKLTDFIQEKFPKTPTIKINKNPAKPANDSNKKASIAQRPSNMDALIDRKLAEKRASLTAGSGAAKKASIAGRK